MVIPALPRLLALVACAALAAGCSGSETTPDAGQPEAGSTDSPSAVVSTSTAPSSTPTVEPTVAPTSDPSGTATPSSRPTRTRPPKPAASVPEVSPALVSVRNDVETVAPQLESYYRDREYPEDLAQVRQTLEGSGITLRPGNTIGGYVYDGDAVEFTLCIENTSGAWATYDTAPMSLRQSGEAGGCP